MANWTENTIMVWRPKLPGDAGNIGAGHPYENGWKVSDHGRQEVPISDNPILTDNRTANGTLRRHFVRSPKKWGLQWENLPGKNGQFVPSVTYPNYSTDFGDFTFTNSNGLRTVDGGMCVEELAVFWKQNPGDFIMALRRGSAKGKSWPNPTSWPYEDDDFYIAPVMITEFSANLQKRGINDLYSVSITLEEV